MVMRSWSLVIWSRSRKRKKKSHPARCKHVRTYARGGGGNSPSCAIPCPKLAINATIATLPHIHHQQQRRISQTATGAYTPAHRAAISMDGISSLHFNFNLLPLANLANIALQERRLSLGLTVRLRVPGD